MLPSPFDFHDNTPIRSEKSNVSSVSSESTVEELRDRVAIRFLLKKTKRFDYLKQQLGQQRQRLQRRQQTAGLRTEPSPECLQYLGLVAKNAKARDRQKRNQDGRPDFQFLKPQIYECSYCSKIFFHKLLYRRHMIGHMKKIHWCLNCNRGFTTKISMRRHKLTCRC